MVVGWGGLLEHFGVTVVGGTHLLDHFGVFLGSACPVMCGRTAVMRGGICVVAAMVLESSVSLFSRRLFWLSVGGGVLVPEVWSYFGW